jgi:hypothetical protein
MLQHCGWRQHVGVLWGYRTDLGQTRQGRIRGDMAPCERGRQGEADKTLQASVEHRITSGPGSCGRLAHPQRSGMGRLNPDPVHSSREARTGRFKPWILEPHIVLRRVTARFFGKILKVDPIVTLHALPKLPALCHLPAEILRSMVVGLWMSLVIAGVLFLTGDSAWPQQLATSPAQTQAPAQAGPAESIYRKNATAPAAPVVNPVAVPVADQAAQAERIVAAALAAMGRAESISARVRQRVRIDDRVLVGAGRYVQSGLGEDQRYRYESSMKSDTETFDLLEVCDGLFAWSYRRIGPQPPLL